MRAAPGWVLVAGYGSIGRRHLGNLRQLGIDDVRVLRSPQRRQGSFETPTGVREYSELDKALSDRPWAVVVANPTALHCSTARASLGAGAHVLLEKPVAADLEQVRELLETASESAAAISVAYCFRYHPLYLALADLVRGGRLGRVFHIRCWQASYLPGWHPWEDYRAGYAARADLGGGVLPTLDHDLDFVRWVMGQPSEVLASVAKLSNLVLDVPDTADLLLRFSNQAQASVHLSLARRDYSRGVTAMGAEGSADLDWAAGTLSIQIGGPRETAAALPPDFDLNSVYLTTLDDALKGFAEDPPRAAVTLDDGVAVFEIASAALRSSASGQSVFLERST